MSAILENGALCESHTFDNVITQFRDPHSLMIDFRHVDKCWYSAATYSKTRAFFGLCCSTNMNFYTNDKKITNQVVYARLTFLFECLWDDPLKPLWQTYKNVNIQCRQRDVNLRRNIPGLPYEVDND